jgi:hypothetical protein
VFVCHVSARLYTLSKNPDSEVQTLKTMNVEWDAIGPCNGTLYLSLVAASFREEIRREHTALGWPKPTDENGLPDWPCSIEAGVRYTRLSAWDPHTETLVATAMANGRVLSESLCRSPWTKESLQQVVATLPVTFIHLGETRPILFSKQTVLGLPDRVLRECVASAEFETMDTSVDAEKPCEISGISGCSDEPSKMGSRLGYTSRLTQPQRSSHRDCGDRRNRRATRFLRATDNTTTACKNEPFKDFEDSRDSEHAGEVSAVPCTVVPAPATCEKDVIDLWQISLKKMASVLRKRTPIP